MEAPRTPFLVFASESLNTITKLTSTKMVTMLRHQKKNLMRREEKKNQELDKRLFYFCQSAFHLAFAS